MAGPMGDVGVNLTVSASSRGLEKLNKQLLNMNKTLKTLAAPTKGSGMYGGAAGDSFLAKFMPKEDVQKVTAYFSDIDKAMEYYWNIVNDFPSSIFARESRYKYRLLREKQTTP